MKTSRLVAHPISSARIDLRSLNLRRFSREIVYSSCGCEEQNNLSHLNETSRGSCRSYDLNRNHLAGSQFVCIEQSRNPRWILEGKDVELAKLREKKINEESGETLGSEIPSVAILTEFSFQIEVISSSMRNGS